MYRAKDIDIFDFEYILDNLREEDKIEAIQAKGENFKEVIIDEIVSGDQEVVVARTKENNTPVLMGGCWPIKENPAIGIVWLLSTPEIKKHQVCFLREIRKDFERYDKQFGLTFNYLYNKNFLAKRWLKWLGYRFPSEIEKKNFLDKGMLNTDIPKDFEIFYRERKIKGLGR